MVATITFLDPVMEKIPQVEAPLMAGKTDSCTLGITKESITPVFPSAMPADTEAWTAATSPRVDRGNDADDHKDPREHILPTP